MTRIAAIAMLLLVACASDPSSRALALVDQTVYVQCAYSPDTGLAATSDGDDAASGDHEHPLRTLQEVQRRYPMAPDGTTLIVQLCGYGGADPCVQPSERRECRIANLHIGGTEVTRNTYQIRGPRKMITLAGLPASLTYTSASAAPGTTTGRSVRLSFSNLASPPNSMAGRFLRVTLADGREMFYPLAIAANDGAGNLTIDSNLSAADIAAAPGDGAAQWSVVIPAVSIRHPDAATRGVVVSGFGAAHFADSDVPVWDGTLERVEIVRPRFWADGLTLDNVMVNGGGEMRGDASRHRQVSVTLPGAYVVLGGSSAQGGGSAWTLYQEHAGRQLGPGDPVAYAYGQDLTIIGPAFVGDFNFGVGIGQLRVHRSLSVRAVPWDVDGAISVIGAGSVLHVTDAGYLFLEHVAPNGVCAWAKEGGRIRARFVGHVDMVGCPGGELKVDTGAPASVAALLESAAKMIIGAFGSQIRDKQAEDNNYYGTNGNGGQG